LDLGDLRRVFGGRIHEDRDRRWLDARVGGLRTFIICRATKDGGVTFDLAVFTPYTREIDPFSAREKGREWQLDGEHVLPRLRAGFVFTGCRGGVLFARNMHEPSLDSIVSTLWDLSAWARKPWRTAYESTQSKELRAKERARARRQRWIQAGWLALVCAFVLWLQSR
jgi:hypothetical protein